MLPFTGPSAGFGANAELAVLLATEQINAAGGVLGKQISLVEGDEFAKPDQGFTAEGRVLAVPDLLGVIGPQDTHLIDSIAPQVKDLGVVTLLPGLSSQPQLSATSPQWFQLSPSPSILGCALGQRLFDDGLHQVGIVYSDDRFASEFAMAAADRYKVLSREDAVLYPTAGLSSDDVLKLVRTQGTSKLALALSAAEAAKLVGGARSLQLGVDRWYFGPQVSNDSFLSNVVPSWVEGMVGVTDSLPTDSADFAAHFTSRWTDVPLTNSYFYYDAMAILALAIESASAAVGGTPSAADVRSHLASVAKPPGEVITWRTLAHGLELVRQGMDVNYQGASGSLDFSDDGGLPAGASLIRFWKVSNAEIVPELFGSCLR